MSDLATVVEQIRTAVTLKAVRTAIADALEYCYDHVDGTSRTQDTDSEMAALIQTVETANRGLEIRESIAAGIELCYNSIALFAPTSDADRSVAAGYIQQIRNSTFGKDARESIAAAIEFCWKEYDSIPTASASGSVVSFDDGADGLPVKSLAVKLEPMQDLHGYDSPWPAGGGVNKLDIATASTAKPAWYPGGWLGTTRNANAGITQERGYTNGSAGGFTFTLKPGETYTVSWTYNKSISESCKCFVSSYNGTEQTIILDNVTVRSSTTRFSVSFTAPSDSVEVAIRPTMFGTTQSGQTYDLDYIQIEFGSTATTYAPYSNICPISGWTEAMVTRTGKNLLPMPITSGSYSYTTTVTVNDDLSFYLTKTSSSGWVRFELGTIFLKAGDYTLIESDDSSQNSMLALTRVSDGTSVVTTRYQSVQRFTLAEDTEVSAVYTRSAVADNLLTKIMLFIGNTAVADDYEPYSSQTYSITLPSEAGTVYGGELTVNEDGTGTLVVDRIHRQLVVDTTWYAAGSGSSAYYGQNNSDIADTAWAGILCNAMPTREITSSTTDWGIGMVSTSGGTSRIAIRPPADAGVTSATTFKAWLNSVVTAIGGDIMVSYPVAPVTYTLTASQVTTLLGTNNVWADVGDITVIYRTNSEGRTQIVTKAIDLYMVRGDTFGFYVVLSDVDTSKIQAVTFTVKKYATDSTPIIQKTLGNGIEASSDPENSYHVRVAPEDTSGISAGKYVYDIEINVAGDIYTVLAGNLEIEQDVTTH